MRAPDRIATLAKLYQRYLEDEDSARLIRDVADRYTIGTLERLSAHPLRRTRRGAVLALGFTADYSSNSILGMRLRDDDRLVRMLAENGIRSLWQRCGNETDRALLRAIVRSNTSQRYRDALSQTTELIEQSPALPEAWNQRSMAYYHLGRYAEAIRDCRQALELNPYHFDAATEMGHAHLHLGKYRSALDSLRRALRLNPDLEGVRAGIHYLERSLNLR